MHGRRWAALAALCVLPFAEASAQVACPGVTIGTSTFELVRASQGPGSFLTAMERLHEVMGFAVLRRVSVGANGQANQASSYPRVAVDGALVVFNSNARNFLSTITAARNHTWARGFCGPTRMVDQSPAGVEGDASSFDGNVSADGTAIAFRSFSDNLIDGVDPAGTRVFIETMDGVSIPGFAAAGTNFSAWEPVLSADGRFVAVTSSTKVDADDNSSSPDIYLRDRMTGTTILVSRHADGGHVTTSADNVFDPAISADGRYVAFVSDVSLADPVDFNGNEQVYLRDTLLGTTTLVSIGFDDEPANEDCRAVEIAGNGCCVVFRSNASNLVEGVDQTLPSVFLRNLAAGTTERVNVDFSTSSSLWFARLPAISHDGRFVAFDSPSPLAGNSNVSTQIYVRDRTVGETRLASRNVLGERGNSASGGGETTVAISADGGWVAFVSTADNLVGGDTNDFADIFVAPNPFTERIPFPDETGF